MRAKRILFSILLFIALLSLGMGGAYLNYRRETALLKVGSGDVGKVRIPYKETGAVVTIRKMKCDSKGLLTVYYNLIGPRELKAAHIGYNIDKDGVWAEKVKRGANSFGYDTTQLENGMHTFHISPFGGKGDTRKFSVHNLIGPIEVNPLLGGYDWIRATLEEPGQWTVTLRQNGRILTTRKGYGKKIEWVWHGQGAIKGDVDIEFKAVFAGKLKPVTHTVSSYFAPMPEER